MIVVYYVNTYYLDAALETIQALKKVTDLHLLIEISPESQRSNIIDIDSLDSFDYIENAKIVLGVNKWKLFAHYFDGLASVHFAVYKSKRSISLYSALAAAACGKYINSLHPDVIHFDSVSPRVIGLTPYLLKKKVFITVHDPVPHSGEGSWKIRMAEYIYFHLARGFFFYSRFASSQFEKNYLSIKGRRHVIEFQPFTFIRQLASDVILPANPVLFFGRILSYKGVDLLLNAIPLVLKKFPDQQFLIAGKPLNCELDQELLLLYQNNIRVIPEHISIEFLASLILSAKFIICPYRDATQSGVLMTTNALGKMVIGTNVGAFPEYIKDGVNGLLVEPDPASIARKICMALEGDYYQQLEKNIIVEHSIEIDFRNQNCLLNAYKCD